MSWTRTLAVLCLASLVVLAGCLGGDGGAGQQIQPDAGGTVDSSSVDATADTGTANGTLEVHVIAVGQANSVLVVAPSGETILYDTGHYEDDGEYVQQYLRERGIDRIDHLVLSHADADHIGGAGPLIDYFETERDGVGAVYDPGIPASTRTYDEYLDAVERHNVTLYETHEGDEIDVKDVDIGVLGPTVPYLDEGNHNANSIVLRLTHGNASFLLTGDAEDDQEGYLVDRYGGALNSTVLTAGHHGSYSSSKESFLDTVDPRLVTISSAYDSPHGHPHENVLTRLTTRSIPAYWTGIHGTTTFVSDGDAVTVRTQRNGPTVATALRTGDPIPPRANDSLAHRETIAVGDDSPSPVYRMTSDGESTVRQLTLAEVQADAPGNDHANLYGEYLVLRNPGPIAVNLSDWTVHDSIGHRYTFPPHTLGVGESVRLVTGSGIDNETHLYWGESDPVWNNDGDTVLVTNADGYPVLREHYD